MRAALAAVKKARKAKVKGKKTAPKKAAVLSLDANDSARLQAASARLSQVLGRAVSAEALLAAGVAAVLAVCDAAAPKPKRKKKR
jgi:hypothetical protein